MVYPYQDQRQARRNKNYEMVFVTFIKKYANSSGDLVTLLVGFFLV